MSKEYTIKVAKSIDDVQEIRDIWEEMQWHPNADIDYYLTVLRNREEILRPHVLLLSRNGKPEEMLIGRIEERALDFKIGYKSLYKPRVRLLTIIYGGVLGNQSHDNAEFLVSELIEFLKQQEVDIVILSNLKIGSHLYRSARTLPSFLCRDHICRTNLHWNMQLPSSFNEFLKKMKSKRRYWLRRIANELEEEYPAGISIICFRDKELVPQMCKDIEEIARKTYQRAIGAGFVYDNDTVARMTLAADKGWLRAYIMYIEKNPSAFWLGLQYYNTFHLLSTGYDPHFRKFEIGTTLFMKMLEDLLAINSIKKMDFGFGDALYKRRYGTGNWSESSVYIFAPRFKGIRVNLVKTLINSFSQFVQIITQRLNLIYNVKRKWRELRAGKIRGPNNQ